MGQQPLIYYCFDWVFMTYFHVLHPVPAPYMLYANGGFPLPMHYIYSDLFQTNRFAIRLHLSSASVASSTAVCVRIKNFLFLHGGSASREPCPRAAVQLVLAQVVSHLNAGQEMWSHVWPKRRPQTVALGLRLGLQHSDLLSLDFCLLLTDHLLLRLVIREQTHTWSYLVQTLRQCFGTTQFPQW